MRTAQRELILDFDRLSQLAHRTFSPEANEEILEASRQFIEDGFGLNSLPAKEEMRLCKRIVTKIDRFSNGTTTQGTGRALRRLLKEVDSKGLVLSNGVVQRALRRPDDSDILSQLRDAAIRRISSQQNLVSKEISKVEIEAKPFPNGRFLIAKVVIESENPQTLDANISHSRPGAKSYTPFFLFTSALFRIYCEAGGTARYTHKADNSFSGEAIDFITGVVAQTCLVLSKEMADSVCPINQGSTVAKVIKNYFKNNA